MSRADFSKDAIAAAQEPQDAAQEEEWAENQ
jgi:hypothetical protein